MATGVRNVRPKGFGGLRFFLTARTIWRRITTKIIADQIAAPVLLSNGNLVDHGPMDNDDGRHYAVWEDPFPQAELFVCACWRRS